MSPQIFARFFDSFSVFADFLWLFYECNALLLLASRHVPCSKMFTSFSWLNTGNSELTLHYTGVIYTIFKLFSFAFLPLLATFSWLLKFLFHSLWLDSFRFNIFFVKKTSKKMASINWMTTLQEISKHKCESKGPSCGMAMKVPMKRTMKKN